MPTEPDAEAARRRLYRPGATEADLDRYRTTTAATTATEPQPSDPTRPPRRRRIRGPLAAGALAAGVAGVLLVALQGRDADPAPVGSRTATSASVSVSEVLRIPADDRRALAGALASGGDPDLSGYLTDHPNARPASLTTLTRADTQERRGTGPGVVDLAPSPLADDGGRVTVVVLLARTGDATWTLTRQAVRTDHRQYRQGVARHRLRLAAGAPRSISVPYSGTAPDRLAVAVPEGAAWDALVVYSD